MRWTMHKFNESFNWFYEIVILFEIWVNRYDYEMNGSTFSYCKPTRWKWSSKHKITSKFTFLCIVLIRIKREHNRINKTEKGLTKSIRRRTTSSLRCNLFWLHYWEVIKSQNSSLSTLIQCYYNTVIPSNFQQKYKHLKIKPGEIKTLQSFSLEKLSIRKS